MLDIIIKAMVEEEDDKSDKASRLHLCPIVVAKPEMMMMMITTTMMIPRSLN